MLLLHGRERCVLDKHVVHELVPVDRATRVSIDSHEQLVELLVLETLSEDFTEGCDELLSNSRVKI